MSQQKDNFVSRGEYHMLLPKNSTAVSGGDAVCMGDKSETKGLNKYKRGLTDARIEPMADDDQAQYFIGICDDDWVATEDDYAAPVVNQNELRVYRGGVFRLAITGTSGNAGDLVVYSSGGTGAQLFAIDNERSDYAVGEIWKTFTGATANDVQEVLIYNNYHMRAHNVYYNLENHVIYGGWVMPLDAGATTANIRVGGGGTGGTAAIANGNDLVFRIKNRILRIAGDGTLAMPNPPGGATINILKVVARSGGVVVAGTAAPAVRAVASWTAVTIGDFPALTSGECLLAYVRAWSASAYSVTSIFNIRGQHDLDYMDAQHNGL